MIRARYLHGALRSKASVTGKKSQGLGRALELVPDIVYDPVDLALVAFALVGLMAVVAIFLG